MQAVLSDFQRTFEARIAALAALTETPGMLTRPSLTPSMKQANALVAVWMQAAGMTTREDAIGNLIGRYEGQQPNAPALVFGSHLDTVIDAGRYDGVLGVLLGLAVVEHLAQQRRRLPFAIEVIAFCDEEGLRFHLPYIGSRAFNGTLTRARLTLSDEQGITLAQGIRDYGGNPENVFAEARSSGDLIGYIEAHIEQGPSLEASGAAVGLVSAIVGQHRAQLTFQGEAGHAGTVPMHLRRDALVAAARFIRDVHAMQAVEGLVATVGQCQVRPGAGNAIPGEVTLSLDVRHADDAVLAQSVAHLHQQAAATAREMLHSEITWTDISINPAVPCSPRLIEALAQAARACGYTAQPMVSGAGHDAVQMAHITDIAMLFVRCRGGISHHPAEFCSTDDAEAALRVLLETVEHLERP